MSSHVSQFTRLAYVVMCVRPLPVIVLLCTLQYCGEYGSTVSLFLACSLNASPCMPAVVLDYCTFQGTVRLKMFYFLCLFFQCIILCEKCYKPITVQSWIADCVSWVLRLTLLDLRTNWTYQTCSWNGTRSYVGDLTVILFALWGKVQTLKKQCLCRCSRNRTAWSGEGPITAPPHTLVIPTFSLHLPKSCSSPSVKREIKTTTSSHRACEGSRRQNVRGIESEAE